MLCPLDGDHPLRVLHRLLPHMKGVKERKPNKSKIMFVKYHTSHSPRTRSCTVKNWKGAQERAEIARKNVIDGKKADGCKKSATA